VLQAIAGYNWIKVSHTTAGAALLLAVSACAAHRSGVDGHDGDGEGICDASTHGQPLLVEWDGTDRSSLEAQAAHDLVLVRYDGCTLTVLDECRMPALRGEDGAYRDPRWSSGRLEALDIDDQEEVIREIPLATTTLGTRVARGETFRLEYYVAGRREAAREAVYRAELVGDPGCEGATHFVDAIELGAFAIGSGQDTRVRRRASVFGFGKSKHRSAAEKQGGDLSGCTAGARTCQAPIRLSLREIRPGQNPDPVAVPPVDPSQVTAAQLAARLRAREQAAEHLEAAARHLSAGEGEACLEELDRHGRLDPQHASTHPDSPIAYTRGLCLMADGKCSAGGQLVRKVLEHGPMVDMVGPEGIDRAVEQTVVMYCKGPLPPREDLLRAQYALQRGSMSETSSAECREHYDVVKKHWRDVKPKDDEDFAIENLASNMMVVAPACFARAGDCKAAREAFEEAVRFAEDAGHYFYGDDYWKSRSDAERRRMLRENFASLHPRCETK
jgi:hypothetical protein